MRFSYTISHVPGKQLYTMDALSRAPVLEIHFARHGILETLVSDNGPQYASQEKEDFAHEYNFVHATSSPYYQQSKGLAERMVKNIEVSHWEIIWPLPGLASILQHTIALVWPEPSTAANGTTTEDRRPSAPCHPYTGMVISSSWDGKDGETEAESQLWPTSSRKGPPRPIRRWVCLGSHQEQDRAWQGDHLCWCSQIIRCWNRLRRYLQKPSPHHLTTRKQHQQFNQHQRPVSVSHCHSCPNGDLCQTTDETLLLEKGRCGGLIVTVCIIWLLLLAWYYVYDHISNYWLLLYHFENTMSFVWSLLCIHWVTVIEVFLFATELHYKHEVWLLRVSHLKVNS